MYFQQIYNFCQALFAYFLSLPFFLQVPTALAAVVVYLVIGYVVAGLFFRTLPKNNNGWSVDALIVWILILPITFVFLVCALIIKIIYLTCKGTHWLFAVSFLGAPFRSLKEKIKAALAYGATGFGKHCSNEG